MATVTAVTPLTANQWTSRVVNDILAGNSPNAIAEFRKQPLANKLTALEDAVVKPRRNSTPETLNAILQQLVRMGALRPSEAGPVYSDLLIRIHKYNSTNVQENLNVLLQDISTLQSEAIRGTDVTSLSNQVVLNSFLSSLPPVTVNGGQENYDAFKQSLRLMVNEAPNVTVFKSGTNTMIQVNIRGVNTVNLDNAFSNLSNYWGIMLDGELIPGGITSKFSSNTRVLMLFVAPYTNLNTFVPDSLIYQLMKLYRESVTDSLEYPEETESEVRAIARDMTDDTMSTAQTMAFLLKNREEEISNPRSLSPRQLNVLRYMQESLMDRIDRNGEDPAQAILNLSYSFSPSYYAANGAFLRRMIAYFFLALQDDPSYFREMYSNKYWTPPASFWTQNYHDFSIEQAQRQHQETAFESGDLPLPHFDRNGEEQPHADEESWMWDDDYGTAAAPTTIGSSSASISIRSPAPSSAPGRSLSSAATPAGMRFASTLAKAVVPTLATTLGATAGDSLYPGYGPMVGSVMGTAANRLLGTLSYRRKRMKESRRRARERIREQKRTPTPSLAPSNLIDDQRVYSSYRTPRYSLMTPAEPDEATKEFSFGKGLPDRFSYLRSKTSY